MKALLAAAFVIAAIAAPLGFYGVVSEVVAIAGFALAAGILIGAVGMAKLEPNPNRY